MADNFGEAAYDAVIAAFLALTSATVHLHSADPGDDGAADELAAVSGYAAVTFNPSTDFGAAAPADGGTRATNDALIGTFTASGGDWATATHMSIMSGGVCWFQGPIKDENGDDAQITVLDGQSWAFQIGTLVVGAGT